MLHVKAFELGLNMAWYNYETKCKMKEQLKFQY